MLWPIECSRMAVPGLRLSLRALEHSGSLLRTLPCHHVQKLRLAFEGKRDHVEPRSTIPAPPFLDQPVLS